MVMTYYKTQTDLADAIILAIEKYWSLDSEEEAFIGQIKALVAANDDLLYKEDKYYTSTMKQRLGKRRLKLLDKILSRQDEKKN